LEDEARKPTILTPLRQYNDTSTKHSSLSQNCFTFAQRKVYQAGPRNLIENDLCERERELMSIL